VSGMKILLTGADGFVGKYLVKELLSGGHDIFAVSRAQRKRTSNNNLQYIDANFENENFCSCFPVDIDVIVHLAQSNHYREFPDKATNIFQVNVNSLMCILDWAKKKTKIKKFIFTSSANVYEMQKNKINEHCSVAATSFYAQTKLMGEDLLRQYSEFFTTHILRLFTIYGPGQKNMLMPNLVNKVYFGEPIQIFGDEGIRLSPLYVLDLVLMLRRVIEIEPKKIIPIYNLGGAQSVSILELSKIIGSALDVKVNIEFCQEEQPAKINRLGWVSDNNKFISNYGVAPNYKLDQGLKQTVKCFVDNLVLSELK